MCLKRVVCVCLRVCTCSLHTTEFFPYFPEIYQHGLLMHWHLVNFWDRQHSVFLFCRICLVLVAVLHFEASSCNELGGVARYHFFFLFRILHALVHCRAASTMAEGAPLEWSMGFRNRASGKYLTQETFGYTLNAQCLSPLMFVCLKCRSRCVEEEADFLPAAC